MANEKQRTTDGEYVTDVAYARNFVDGMAPSMLRLVAAMNGFACAASDDFDFCELGCGNGDTTATLAAANPRGRFVGIDLNPEHVAFGTDLAKRGGLDNVRFLERAFEDVEHASLPEFDFIGMHGVLSWVGAETRATVIALASAKLKPGGLLYASYNALPGWSAIEPLRRLMLEFTRADASRGSLDRARHGVQLARAIRDAGGVYFASHPTALSMLDLMEKAGLPYVVHEYFHKHWHPMYFADVARELAARGLEYVGQLPLYLNLRELAIPSAMKSIAASLESSDRHAFEHLKDFALNEFFRNDVYVKSPATSSQDTMHAYMEGTRFGTLVAAPLVKRELRLPHYTMQFAGSLYDAVISAISERASSASELAERTELASFGVHRIADALRSLALGGQVVPFVGASRSHVGTAKGHRVRSTYDRMILRERLSNRAPLVLASDVVGTGIPWSMLDAVCLRLLTEVPIEDRARWTRAFVEEHPLRLVVGGEKTSDKDELTRAVLREAESFAGKWLPKLIELGIVEAIT